MAIKEFTDKNGRIRHEIYVHKRDKNGKRYQRKATASTKMEAKRIEAQFLIELNQVLSGKPNM
ncbi:MAG: hypothetical protein IT290_06360 [Deltaproteobacteria bacterium]|nr:hypothetical protein [Deltaproteobacteria bacterium]